MSVPQTISEELQTETMRTQVMVGHALRSIAKSEVYGGMTDGALQSLVTVGHILDEVRVYASAAPGMPEDAALEMLEFVRELQQRARILDEVLHVLKAGPEPGAGKSRKAGDPGHGTGVPVEH